MLQFMGENKKLLKFHEQKFAELEDSNTNSLFFQTTTYAVEEANYLNEQRAYHFKPNPNLPTHYTPALRNHENFCYGGGVQNVPRHGQNFQ